MKSIKKCDVMMICSYLIEGAAAFRRLSFLEKYLSAHGICVRCLGAIIIGSNNVSKPPFPYLSSAVLLSSKAVSSVLLNIMLSFSLIFTILSLKPKVVILSIPDFSALIPVYLGCKFTKAKLIIDIRDPTEEILFQLTHNKLDKQIIKIIRKINYLLYPKADAIITVTDALRRMLKEKIGVDAFTVPNGADLTVFRPLDKLKARKELGLSDDSFIIIFIGSVGGYYNIHEFLKAFTRVTSKYKNRLKFILAGPILDQLHTNLLKTCTFKLQKQILYFGYVNTEKIRTLLSAADIGLIPRTDDPVFNYAIPAKFYEYVAMGLPVLAICKRNSELWSIINKNKLGKTCEPNDITCIGKSLELFMFTDYYNIYKQNVEQFKKYTDRKRGGEILMSIVRQMLYNGHLN